MLGRALHTFRQPHFTPYKALVHRPTRTVICLNPKVGSTAFRNILVEGMKQIGLAPMRSRLWPINETRRYTTAPLWHYLHAFGKPDAYTFHCFVRNPYSRVISAWNDKLVKGFHAEQYPRSMRRLIGELREFAKTNQLPGENDDAPLPFATFLSYIESQKEGTRNQHWDTQTSVLCARTIDYTHAYPMETQFLIGMINILAPLGIEEQWITEKVSRPMNASGEIAEPVLDQALADRIYDLYQEDFQRFGYERDSWEGL